MDNNITKKQNAFISEEEKTLNWEEIQNSFKKNFGNEVYNSWLQKISLVKEYNDYLILGVPTRFFRDWIVSRYLDKILEQVKNFKLSLNRIEFKIIEENKQNQEFIKIDDLNKVTDMAITAKFRNNGQVCISPARFYIHEKKKDEFAKTLVEKVSKLKIGNGMDDDTILGPLTTEKRLNEIEALVEKTKKEGATVLCLSLIHI